MIRRTSDARPAKMPMNGIREQSEQMHSHIAKAAPQSPTADVSPAAAK
jgi:hypothetical protein